MPSMATAVLRRAVCATLTAPVLACAVPGAAAAESAFRHTFTRTGPHGSELHVVEAVAGPDGTRFITTIHHVGPDGVRTKRIRSQAR
ncbi:hypothetical protein [Marinitenerispora sediminis]|uniref:Uncharacterized protein n=1 Tax=Marinitenerispora sediminis TaxID=1931232 RepID=A0A368SZB6_9ACTN|nr:hypothetical protein [Marinitenerispora sediminis]RCV48831.1 hypothetical protein DEF23_24440 [Marinitenerispora sediminis]RCV49546.1 hypothetical protein DEF28_20525 [Marinitenerispora sediminis]RCV50562.1 hypothetical protein DEF24_24080 [Marinitenerispora sediminis]